MYGHFCCGGTVYCGMLVERAGFWSGWFSGHASGDGCHLTGWQHKVLACLALGPRGFWDDVGFLVEGGMGQKLIGCWAQGGPGLVPACCLVRPGIRWLVAGLGEVVLREFLCFHIWFQGIGVFLYINLCVCIYIIICKTNIFIHTHTHTHTYTHTHIYIHIWYICGFTDGWAS